MRPRGGTHFRRANFPALTERQREVMRLLERGETNGQIAEALGITLDGAKFHVAEIIGRLGVTTREEAVEVWGRRPGRLTRLSALPTLRWTAGVAAAAFVAATIVVWVSLAAGDGDGEIAAAVSPTTLAGPPFAGTSAAPCPTTSPVFGPGLAANDWIEFVQFNRVMYWSVGGFGFTGPDIRVPVGALGPEYARVAFTLEGNVRDPDYQIRDCDASFLPAGTSLFSISGYDPRFRIALADGKVYESYAAQGIKTAGEITDLNGKVTRIEFRTNDTPPITRGRIDDSATVTRLVADFLAARFDDSSQPAAGDSAPPNIRVAFVLSDGTEFTRPYQPAAGWVWPGIWLPASFNDAANAALASP